MEPNNVAGIAKIPEIIQYAAWFVIVVVGALAAKFGIGSVGSKTATTESQITGGLVDNRAIKALADSLDDAIDEMKDMHREEIDSNRRLGELIDSLGTDVRLLNKSLIRIFEKIN